MGVWLHGETLANEGMMLSLWFPPRFHRKARMARATMNRIAGRRRERAHGRVAAMTNAGAERALDAWAALRRAFAADHDLFRETAPARRGERYAHLWPYSQVLGAALDLFGLGAVGEDSVRAALAGLARYWDEWVDPHMASYDSVVRPPLGRGGDKFYDDNAWVGLHLVRAHRLTGDAAALRQAQRVFTFITGGWADDTASTAHAGGVYWKLQTARETNRDRNIVSNAPSAELGLRLHALTGHADTLNWARRMWAWAEIHLKDPADGLYWDHLRVNAAGSHIFERTKWSYNQGTMLGACVLLAEADALSAPSAPSLARARAIAQAGLAYLAERYPHQDPAFNAIWFRNLLLLWARLAEDDPLRAAILSALRQHVDWAWATVRDPATGLFRFGGAAAVPLIDQAAMVEMLACLACPPARYDLIV